MDNDRLPKVVDDILFVWVPQYVFKGKEYGKYWTSIHPYPFPTARVEEPAEGEEEWRLFRSRPDGLFYKTYEGTQKVAFQHAAQHVKNKLNR
jgi:hypothetical protein